MHNALHVCKGRLFTAAGCVLLVQRPGRRCHLVVDGLQSTLRNHCCCRVTGRGYMDVNRISGYIPGKIVFFLMQVRFTCALLCKRDRKTGPPVLPSPHLQLLMLMLISSLRTTLAAAPCTAHFSRRDITS